jgi:broad specificity phosphatase PhoE
MLILVRHGQTAANAAGLLLGHADVELDDTGRRQAAAVAEAIGPADLVVSSPLKRARQTAAAIQSDVVVDQRLIELDYGEWDEQPARSIDPLEWAMWRASLDFAPPGGESLAALGARVRSCCEDYSAAARDGTVVFVTHVSPIKAAVAWALGATDQTAWHMFVTPGSLVRIQISARGPILMKFGEQPPADV